MSSDDLTHDEITEKAREEGERDALRGMLSDILRRLGYEDIAARQAAWVSEREFAIMALRDACETYGDNDWPNDLNLGDVIRKHLVRHLG